MIKVVWVEAKLKGSPYSASTYPLSKKRAIIQALNNAFARLGLSFQLVQVGSSGHLNSHSSMTHLLVC